MRSIEKPIDATRFGRCWRLAGLATLLTALALALAPAATSQAQTKPKAAPAGDAALQKRVEQLEEQIVDLQVIIGTLESLAKTGGHGSGNSGLSGGGGASGGGGQLRGLETQINALTSQVERLARDVEVLQGGQPSRVQGFRDGKVNVPSQEPSFEPQVAGARQTMPTPGSAADAPAASVGGFGATTVTPNPGDDAIGGLIQEAARLPEAQQAEEQPRSVYEAAYGHLLQQNYQAAQAGFREFLRRFPDDTLVPNALYWLGETYYVQQNYSDAAEAFDIVTAAYASSNKAPDSQLKRAMSLANLGKRNEACSAFRSLATRYPNAPEHVKSKADSESERVGCS